LKWVFTTMRIWLFDSHRIIYFFRFWILSL
jgi:hypothetical protein